MGTDCKSAAFSFGGSNPPAPTKNSSVAMTLEFLFYPKLYKAQPRVDLNSCGAVAEDSAKTAQWAVFSSAARESTRAHQTRKIRTCFRLEKGSDFSFSSGMIAIRIFNSLATTANCMSQRMLFCVGRILTLRPTKAPVDGAKLRCLVIGRKPITRFGGCDYEVR